MIHRINLSELRSQSSHHHKQHPRPEAMTGEQTPLWLSQFISQQDYDKLVDDVAHVYHTSYRTAIDSDKRKKRGVVTIVVACSILVLFLMLGIGSIVLGGHHQKVSVLLTGVSLVIIGVLVWDVLGYFGVLMLNRANTHARTVQVRAVQELLDQETRILESGRNIHVRLNMVEMGVLNDVAFLEFETAKSNYQDTYNIHTRPMNSEETTTTTSGGSMWNPQLSDHNNKISIITGGEDGTATTIVDDVYISSASSDV